jgi:O-antigen/teichoic acid export membrane protein
MHLCYLGIGDAALVLAGQKRVTVQEALSAAMMVVIVMGSLGAIGFWLVWSRGIGFASTNVRAAVMISSIGLPVGLGWTVFSYIINSRERIVATSAMLFCTHAVTTLFTGIFVVLAKLSVLGAASATLIGTSIGMGLAVKMLAGMGLSLRPRWHLRFLRAAVPLGAKLQVSTLLMLLTGRADLLMVYRLLDPAAAGHYSVALTMGSLVAMAPMALTCAAFPRLANLSGDAARELAARVCRSATCVAVLAAVVLLPLMPGTVRTLFGRAYMPAVAPAVILLTAYVAGSSQWVLCRAAAARAEPGVLVWSYGTTFVLMCSLDWLLIPHFRLLGAGAAALLATFAGLLVSLHGHVHPGIRWLGLGALLPGYAELRELLALATTWRLRLTGYRWQKEWE